MKGKYQPQLAQLTTELQWETNQILLADGGDFHGEGELVVEGV